MVKTYLDGKTFYEDNKKFLLSNPYTEVFFRLDSEHLSETNKKEYAIKVTEKDCTLVALLKEPYPMLVFGDKSLSSELAIFLDKNDYLVKDFMGPVEVGNSLLNSFNSLGYNFECSIRMDFMECRAKHAPSSEIVELANDDDLDEIYNMMLNLVKDCGLNDVVIKEKVKSNLPDYRLIRDNGIPVSFAAIFKSSDEDKKIACVYTKPEYRGRKFAQQVVNYCVNEIMDQGYFATLNVDQNNPVSYHVYESIGFKKVFSQGIYYKK